MSTDNRTKRFKKRWNRFFFGNDLRAKITSNLIRAAAATMVVVSVVAVLAAFAICSIIVIPAALIPVVGISVALGGMILIGSSELLAMKMLDKANDLEKDYKKGTFKDFEEDLPDVNNPLISNFFERAKRFIKMIANTVVEQGKKIWSDFHHFFFGNKKRKLYSSIFMGIVGGLIFLSAMAIPFALLLANIVGVAFYATATVVGIFIGCMISMLPLMCRTESYDEQTVQQPEKLSVVNDGFMTLPILTAAIDVDIRPANNGTATASPRFMAPPRELPDNRGEQSYEIDDASREWMESHGMSLEFGSGK